jgi:hypothetical protein
VLLGNWIIAARTKRIASQDPTDRKPTSAKRTMSFERFDRVRGAAWIIAARGGQERRERHLVAANEKHEKCSHGEAYAFDAAVVTRSRIVSTSD